MKLGQITSEDIPELVEMAKLAHAESQYNHLPFSARSVIRTFNEHIESGFAVKVVADKITGFFLGEIGGFVFSDVPVSIETTYYVRPEYRGTRCFYLLIRAFIEWSGDRPQLLMPHFAIDNSKTYTALEKLGFSQAGRIYTRGI